MLGCTLGELGQRMSAHEFGLWEIFLEREWVGPGGDQRRWAHQAALLANGPLSRKDEQLWEPSEFLEHFAWPEPDPEASRAASTTPTTADLQAQAAILNAGLG